MADEPSYETHHDESRPAKKYKFKRKTLKETLEANLKSARRTPPVIGYKSFVLSQQTEENDKKKKKKEEENQLEEEVEKDNGKKKKKEEENQLEEEVEKDNGKKKKEEEENLREEEEEERDNRPSPYGYDVNGDPILCNLTDWRKVTLQRFNGKTLVSIREYCKKGRKKFPTSKGISLTMNQWKTLRDAVPAIDNVVKQLQGC